MLLQNRDTVVFAGDSITDASKALYDNIGIGYVRNIDSLLNVCYPENIYKIMNAGVSGNTSLDLVTRWQADVLDKHPNVVVCCIGVNDVWRQFDCPADFNTHVSKEQYAENLEKIVMSTVKKVRKMILMTPYYIELDKNDPMRKMMDEYAAEMKRIAAKYEITCIDLQKNFDEYLKYRHSTFITWDKIHPGWIGSLIITRAFFRAIGFDRQLY